LLSTGGEVVITGRKQAFCLLDYARYFSSAGPGKYTCEFQGISAGWQDVYGKYLDCQWLDVTGVAGGDYLLRVTIDPDGVLPDGNRANNSATVPVTIREKHDTEPEGRLLVAQSHLRRLESRRSGSAVTAIAES
jgi:hypothetical protein